MTPTTATFEARWRIGQRASFDATIDDGMIRRFADLSGDHNPLHVDDAYAARTSFQGRIAHGMIAGALFSRLVGEHLPGEQALYRAQELRFVAPLRPGVEVTVEGEIVDSDPALGLLTLATRVTGRGGAPTFVEGRAEVLVRELPAERADGEPLPARAGAGLVQGQRVWIIGGSRGIGAAVSRAFAQQGAGAIAIGYRRDSGAAELLAEELRATGARASCAATDLAEADSIERAAAAVLAEFGGLDTLVLCGHGKIESRGLERATYEAVELAVRRAAGGLFHAARAVLPAFKARRGGAIIAISSSVTLEAPPAAWLAYTVAKSALVGMARSLATELGPYGIRVNLVAPTLTETEGVLAQPPRIREELAARSPLGRLARPEDVAASVVFLASEHASYLSGVQLPVAGGSIL